MCVSFKVNNVFGDFIGYSLLWSLSRVNTAAILEEVKGADGVV